MTGETRADSPQESGLVPGKETEQTVGPTAGSIIRISELALGLIQLRADIPELVQQIPARDVRAWDWSEDRQSLAVLDLSGKRIQLFDLSSGELVRRPEPAVLPKNAFGASLLFRTGLVYVGGHTRKGAESLWVLREGVLVPIALPEGTGGAGKSIDLLYLQGRELVAVDDFLIPKWILTFRLGADGLPVPAGVIPLRVHGTSEQTLLGVTGRDAVALYSRSVGRSGVRGHLYVLSRGSKEQIGHCSASLFDRPTREFGFPQGPGGERNLESGATARAALEPCPRMSFVADLLVLGGPAGLFVLDVGARPERRLCIGRVGAPRQFEFVDLVGVEDRGCLVAWRGAGDLSIDWLPREELELTASRHQSGEGAGS